MSSKLGRIITFIIVAALCVVSVPTLASAEENGDYKLLAITFDDGPSKYTEKLLDALKERGVPATFFMVGTNAARYPDLLERMVSEGHQIANHSYDHANLAKLSESKIRNNLNSCRQYLVAAGGDQTYYLRPPYGSTSSAVRSAAGAPLILWSVDPRDWDVRNTNTVVNNIMNATKDGDIILLHDIYSTSVDAAIIVIDKLMAQGYEFVTVSELLRRRGVDVQNGSSYYSARNNGVNLGPLVEEEEEEEIDPEEFDETYIESHHAYDALRYACQIGIMSRDANGAYYPNKYLTRGMFATILGRFAGVQSAPAAQSVFNDVEATAYYAPYVEWAAEAGIMTGYGNGSFGPETPITREQLAVCLERYLRLTIPELSVSIADVPTFADDADMQPWSRDSIYLCAGLGILLGNDKNCYNPADFATRGQGAIIFERLSKYLDPDGYAHNVAVMNGEAVDPEPELPDADAPDAGTVETDTADANAPDTDTPETEQDDSDISEPSNNGAGGTLSDGITALSGVILTSSLFIKERSSAGKGKRED